MSTNSNFLGIKLVVFDLDGTLIDSAPDIIQTTNRFLDSENKPHLPSEVIRNAIGEGLRGLLVNLFAQEYSTEEDFNRVLKKYFQFYEEDLCSQTELYPTIFETLSSMKIPFALLTNKGEKHTHMTLKKLSLDKFSWLDVIGGDTLSTKKPDPEGLMRIMGKAHLSPKEVLMVGDGLPDMKVAKKVGCWSLACQYGYTRQHLLEAEKPHFFVENPENLLKAISLVDDLVRNGYKGPL